MRHWILLPLWALCVVACQPVPIGDGGVDGGFTYEFGTGLLQDGGEVDIAFGTSAGTAVQGNDPRLSDSRSPAPGSPYYIQNTQPSGDASYDIPGTGTIHGQLVLDTDSPTGVLNPVFFAQNTTTSPVWNNFRTLQLDSAGGFLLNGQLGVGLIPATGAGFRFMWHPFKAAVRFGGVSAGNSTFWDDANVGFYSFAGGHDTEASAFGTFAFGDGTIVSGTDAVGFGSSNIVSGTAGTSTGASNKCTGFGCVALGFTNTAAGQGSVAIGYRCTANADYAVALGHRASNFGRTGTFVWGDESTTDSVRNQANNEFRIRAAGGIALRTSTASSAAAGVAGNTGCDLPAGSGTFSCSSSREIKENLSEVDDEGVLRRLAQMPVTEWNFTHDPNKAKHLGPMAQDFFAAYGLGESNTAIGVQDLAGVALSAAKALEKRTREVDELRDEVDELRKQLRRLEGRMQTAPLTERSRPPVLP